MNFEKIIDRTLGVYKETDELINQFPNCCKKGCSFCCHQNIVIVATEELSITKYLDTNVPDPVKSKIKIQLINWITYFNINTPNRTLNQEDINFFEQKVAIDKIPCFFLVDGVCSIYPVRPLACRSHIVENDPLLCDKDRRRDGTQEAKTIRDTKLNQLLDSAPKNFLRIMAYPFSDYFKLNIDLKPIKIIMWLRAPK
jgi:Fe-S-cluster containining protein